MRKRSMFIISVVILACYGTLADSAEAGGISAVDLNLIPSAETLGRGGFSISVGMFSYDKGGKTAEVVDVDIGGFFKEKHRVEFESDIWLIPSRITYGITENLDFTFGGTYSSGDTDKIVKDYYRTEDVSRDRVYSQEVLDGILGMKYQVQQGTGRLPTLAVGGEVQMGYTVDDKFVDDTPGDSFPFLAMQIYMSGSYDLEAATVHGGVGMFVSSKSIESGERFDLPIQAGAEIPFNGFAAVLDVTLFKAFSGVGLENIVSAGLRYDISSRATLNVSAASAGGFLVRLTVGGRKPVVAAPPSAPALF